MISPPLIVDSCDDISALRRASIHPESVTSRWKQADRISCLSDVYHLIDTGMLLVHVYGHQNRGKTDSTLHPVVSLNVRLDVLVEFIIAPLLSSLAPITTI